jgi:hypothetical protein
LPGDITVGNIPHIRFNRGKALIAGGFFISVLLEIFQKAKEKIPGTVIKTE